MIYAALLLCGAVALVFYILEKIRSYSLKAVLIKSIVSTLFVAVAVYGTWRAAERGSMRLLCPFVLLGLVFGLLGDIWLDLKYVFPQKDRDFTLAGFSVFGIGHLLFLAGLLLTYYPAGKPQFVLPPLLLALLFSVGNLLLEKPMKLNYGELKPAVAVYGAILFSVVLISGSLAIAHGWRELPLNLFFAGSVLFALSDLILSGTYFGVGRERPIDLTLNYVSYYGAQFLIASSLVFLS